MKAYLHTGPRGKFVGVMDSYIQRVLPTSTQEIEVRIWSHTRPTVINLRLSLEEAKELMDNLNRILVIREAPSVI